MKRGTPDHPKMLQLAEFLGVPIYAAVGLMESLWHWCAKYAPAGDIGRWSNAAIARGVGWDGDPDALVQALEKSSWLDAFSVCRYVVHDWPDHCDDGVHMALGRATRLFADGQMPSLSRFGKAERSAIAKAYKQSAARTQETHPVCIKSTPPSQAPPSPAIALTPPQSPPAVAAALQSLGVSERKAKTVAKTPGLTPLIVYRLWRLCQSAESPPGLLVAKCEGGDGSALPEPIPPEELCELCKAGVVVSVSGIAVNGSTRWNSECLSLDGHKIPAAELRSDAVEVKT